MASDSIADVTRTDYRCSARSESTRRQGEAHVVKRAELKPISLAGIARIEFFPITQFPKSQAVSSRINVPQETTQD